MNQVEDNFDIDTLIINRDDFGRYCLNELHKAAGGKKTHQPSNFFRLDSTVGLINELRKSEELKCEPLTIVKGKGRLQGTYVVRELVYSYAMWISPEFTLKVIREYDRLATQGVAVHENHTEAFLINPMAYIESLMGQAAELLEKRKSQEIVALSQHQSIAKGKPIYSGKF